MKTAVIYARYSCDAQTEQSIEGQLRVCEDYAKKNEILILDTYIDRAMTGTNDHRPDFQRMIKDSAKRKWDYVLVYKLDRFSRDRYESSRYKYLLSQHNVKVVSAMENIPDSPEGVILESLLEGMNQYYSLELAQKVRRGMYETRRKGNYQGGGLPYGYVACNKKVVIDEENNRIEVVVPQEQFSIAIGRRGQNVKLASQLLGCDIDVLTEEQEQERRSNENKVRSQRFMEALDVDEMIAHLLIAEGFSKVDEIALVSLNDLAEIEGFDEDVAQELQSRAKEYIAKRDQEFEKQSKSLGIDDKLQTVDGLDRDMLLTLANANIKTIDDLADLAADELIEILGENTISVQEANKIIMNAREHWFE